MAELGIAEDSIGNQESRIEFSTLFREDNRAQENDPALLRQVPFYDLEYFLSIDTNGISRQSRLSAYVYPDRRSENYFLQHVNYTEYRLGQQNPDLEVEIKPAGFDNDTPSNKIIYEFTPAGTKKLDGRQTNRIIYDAKSKTLKYFERMEQGLEPNSQTGEMKPKYDYIEIEDLATEVIENEGYLPYEYERFKDEFEINPAGDMKQVRRDIAARISQVAQSI